LNDNKHLNVNRREVTLPFDPPLTDAEFRRDEAMLRVEHSTPPPWRAEAEAVLDGLIALGGDFSSDDLWAVLPAPPEPRALGPVIQRAAKEGRIKRCGWVASRRPERQCGPVSVWRPCPASARRVQSA